MAFAVHSKVAFGFFGGECFVGEGDLVNPAPPPQQQQQVHEGGFAAEDESDGDDDDDDDDVDDIEELERRMWRDRFL